MQIKAGDIYRLILDCHGPMPARLVIDKLILVGYVCEDMAALRVAAAAVLRGEPPTRSADRLRILEALCEADCLLLTPPVKRRLTAALEVWQMESVTGLEESAQAETIKAEKYRPSNFPPSPLPPHTHTRLFSPCGPLPIPRTNTYEPSNQALSLRGMYRKKTCFLVYMCVRVY
jgi:hypothetical protein